MSLRDRTDELLLVHQSRSLDSVIDREVLNRAIIAHVRSEIARVLRSLGRSASVTYADHLRRVADDIERGEADL